MRARRPGPCYRPDACSAVARGGLRADVVKIAHHGSRRSSTEAFVAAVRPRRAVVSLAAGNRYGFPHAEALARWRAAGAEVLRTDEGAIRLLEEVGKGSPLGRLVASGAAAWRRSGWNISPALCPAEVRRVDTDDDGVFERTVEFAEKANLFADYLPYAIVFQCVHKWAKAFEGLGRCDLVNQMTIDVQDRRLTRFGVNHVTIPDLFEHVSRHKLNDASRTRVNASRSILLQNARACPNSEPSVELRH